jgi:hypothetical protein
LLQVHIQEAVAQQPVRASRGKRSSPRQIGVSRSLPRTTLRPPCVRCRCGAGEFLLPTSKPSLWGWPGRSKPLAMPPWSNTTLADRKVTPGRLSPLDVQSDDYRVDLIRQLSQSLASRHRPLRCALAKPHQEIVERFADHLTRRTAQPTAERLREALHKIRLPIVSGTRCVQ